MSDATIIAAAREWLKCGLQYREIAKVSADNPNNPVLRRIEQASAEATEKLWCAIEDCYGEETQRELLGLEGEAA